MATKKRTKKKSETQKMNDTLRGKAGVRSDTADLEAAYIEGLEALDEFMDQILADAEEKKAAAIEAGNEDALVNADEGETNVAELGEAFLEIYTSLGELLGIEVMDEDGSGIDDRLED